MAEAVTTQSLTYEIERDGDATVVKCHGRLVSGQTDGFYKEVHALLAGTKELTIDLGEVTYTDSMGLGTLVRLYVSSKHAGCQLRLLHMGKQLTNLLTLTNLTHVLADAEGHNINVA